MARVATSFNMPISLTDKGKEYKFGKRELYMKLLDHLSKLPITRLFDYINSPEQFSFEDNSDEFKAFFIEFLPEFIKTSNKWTDDDLARELEDYATSNEVHLDRPRLKECHECGTDLTEIFALSLTTDALLNDDKILIVCPKCGRSNYFKANF